MTDPVSLPIDGTLDLHTFRPDEVKDVVTDYLAECREQGVLQVRIIHGKGIGTLREMVHAMLSRMPEVASYRLGDDASGGWGATIVHLKPM
jgi:dsDNA-specific endonuclease/ATPase MutS2